MPNKKFGIIYSVLFSYNVVFSQKLSFHLDSVLNFVEIPITYNNISRVVSTKAESDRFLIAFINEDRFYLYDYNHRIHQLEKSSFKLKSKYPIGAKPYDFVVTDKFVYFLLDKKLSCLSKIKKKELYTFNCGNAEYLFLTKQNLISGFYYNHHPKDSPYKAGLKKYDLQGNQIDSIFLNVPFPEYTHYLPKKLIAFNGQKFVFPLFNGLNFLLVDSSFKNVDTLIIPVGQFDSNWVLPSTNLSQSIANNMDDLSLYWGSLDKSNSSKISRIEHVQFLDSTILFVRWFSNDSKTNLKNRYSLKLVKQSNSWHAIEANSYIETPLPFNTSLNVYGGGFPLLSHNYLTDYTKDYIYQVKIDIPYIENLTYKEYYQKKKEKEKVLEPVISLWVFKYD